MPDFILTTSETKTRRAYSRFQLTGERGGVKRVVEGHEVQGSGVGFQAPFPPAMGSGERCKLPQRPPSGFTTSEELRKASPDTSVVLLL